jgi:hypothetical protein
MSSGVRDIGKVGLEPSEPDACPQALEAIRASDNLVLGPGSWFTSVMPHLLVLQMPRWAKPISFVSTGDIKREDLSRLRLQNRVDDLRH